MLTIPQEYIVVLGLIACAREAYNVFWIRKTRSIGSLFSFTYMTIVYMLLKWGALISIEFHGGEFVRAGIFLIFLDKGIAFAYEIYSRRRKWII